MAILSLMEMSKLKSLVTQYGYAIHMHDTCGGQSFTLEPISSDLNQQVYTALKDFFNERGMKLDFYDKDKLNFVAK